MTHWTKPEHYTPKALAWTVLRERLAHHGPAIAPFHADFLSDLGDGPHSSRTFDWGGRRSGKTYRTGFDLAKGHDKSVTWINGRPWILE